MIVFGFVEKRRGDANERRIRTVPAIRGKISSTSAHWRLWRETSVSE
jgi:hypothetical protein